MTCMLFFFTRTAKINVGVKFYHKSLRDDHLVHLMSQKRPSTTQLNLSIIFIQGLM